MSDAALMDEVGQDTPVENWTDQELSEASQAVQGESVPPVEDNSPVFPAEPVVPPAKETDPFTRVTELAKQLEGLQKLTAKRESEYGEMKKRQQELLERLAAKNETPAEEEFDLDYANPQQIKAKMLEIARAEREATEAGRLQEQQLLDNRRNLITGKFPEFDQYLPDIGELVIKLIGDEAPGVQDAILQLKSNPYKEDPLTLMFASEAVKANRRIAELEKQVNSTRDSKGLLLKKIERAAQTKPTIMGDQNGTAKHGLSGLGDKAVEHLSDEELNRQLSQLMRRG